MYTGLNHIIYNTGNKNNNMSIRPDFEAPTQLSLLGQNDPPPFSVIKGHDATNRNRIILSAEHASSAFPETLGNLGCDHIPDLQSRHFVVDVGVRELTTALQQKLGVDTILGNYSRLVIDKMRFPNHSTFIARTQDGFDIPGNINMTDEERTAREVEIYNPYHDHLKGMVRTLGQTNAKALLIAIHSMEPYLEVDSLGNKVTDPEIRPQTALLFRDKENAIAEFMADRILETAPVPAGEKKQVGMNVPYNAIADVPMFEYTGLPRLVLEVRNDLLRTPEDIEEWASALAPIIHEASLRTDLIIPGNQQRVGIQHGSRRYAANDNI